MNEALAEPNGMDGMMIPGAPAPRFEFKDELIKAIELGKMEKGLTAFKNLNITTSKLSREQIEYIFAKIKLMQYTTKTATTPACLMSSKKVYDDEIEHLLAYIGLNKARDGYFGDLTIKHHQVYQQNIGGYQDRRKSFLSRLLRL
jgi:hypothetical protein